MENKTPIIISIEANIGAGKSTILQSLQEILNPVYATCVQEPIHYWENFRDPTTNRSLLELFYSDPAKYAFPLQTMIYTSLARILQQAINLHPNAAYRPMIITERSLHSCNAIFTKMLHDAGTISPVEYQIYQNCIAHNPPPLNVCIYLRTTPEVCHERIKMRDRQGEEHIELEYLTKCHEAHENWIVELIEDRKTLVWTVDANQTKTPDDITADVLEILAELTHI